MPTKEGSQVKEIISHVATQLMIFLLQRQSVSAAVAEEDTNSEEDIALVADEHTHHSDVWVLDSGASYHILS